MSDVATSAIACGDEAQVLAIIRDDEAALTLWRRPVPPVAMTIDLDTVDDVALLLNGKVDIAGALETAGYPAHAVDALARDIAMLADRHRALCGAQMIRLRLDVVETDACRRFHADYVTLRMLCTYRGPGTQYCLTDAPDVIGEMTPGMVGVFKGRLSMEEPRVLHRSPPIHATRGQRLVLVLDPA